MLVSMKADGPVDRAVDMALGRQMHDHVDLMAGEQVGDGRSLANVGLHEAVVGIVLDLPERLEIAGIGQLVDIDDDDGPGCCKEADRPPTR